MAYNVSALTDYTEQQKFPLITKSLFESKTISMMTPHVGIKSAETLNFIDTNARFQTGGTCAWNASGDTSFSQRTLTVGKLTVMEELCPKALESKYVQSQLPSGSHYTGLPFEQEFTELKAGLIAEQMETAVWQGDTSSGDANLSKFDGLLKIIDAASATVIHATEQASISASTVRGIFENIYTLIPVAIINKEDIRVFVGWDTFRTLTNKLTVDNLYHYTADDAARSGEMFYPGTTLKIVAVHGLNTTNRIIAARLSNLHFGTDLMNEEEQFRIFEFQDGSDAIRFKAEWKAGVQIAFPNEIVEYQNS